MPPLEAHPLWRFSLAVYRRPGVEPACLALQDRFGADVNIVLACCWAAAEGRGALGTRTLRAAIAASSRWQREVIIPLRGARRSLKRGIEGGDPARLAGMRRTIGRVELESENAEQRLLAGLIEALPRVPGADRARSARTAIARYFACLGAPPDAAARASIAVIIGASLAV